MSVSNPSFRGRSLTYGSSSDLPENIGNRKTFEEIKIPPDNVGNHEEQDAIATFVHDGLGNSLDEEPSHLKSGVLCALDGSKNRIAHKRGALRNVRNSPVIGMDRVKKPPQTQVAPMSLGGNLSAEDYMTHLTNEFTRLLRLRLGAPFAFSMKPMTDSAVNEEQTRLSLDAILKIIRDILQAASIAASATFAEYRTENHRFAVFYVSPQEKDAIKNKDLISALRQIIKLHVDKHPQGQTNVLLVLANAQHVIEDHLYKLGAKKVESESTP